ncbi:hypothetical protein XELAEV_18000365mg [Xenopus laevis]|uniref:Reverse transcriptase zinc-binding domain-containing protein n=1 Tax=Xenopus laevis TaxID=8355 RepID=A0A974GZ77_XENLA|nr:hypothetical protein XELAEV_18000365mg [Xenopus laevis]
MHKAELSTDITENPLLYSTWLTWKELRKQNNLNSNHSLYLPLLLNPDFQSGRALAIYQSWRQEGVTTVRQLTKNDTHKLLTLAQFQTKFPPIMHNIFAFLQAQTYTSRTIRLLADKDWDNSLDRYLLRTNSTRGVISQNYRFLQDNIDYDSLPTGPKQWTIDIPELGMEDILKMYKQLWHTLPSSIYREMFLNLLHRTYLTPKVLFKMHRRESSDCPKCGQTKANLIHCLLACPFIRRIWNQIRDYATRHLTLSHSWALWGTTPNTHTKSTRGAKRLLLIITAMAKKIILQVWISNTPPIVKLFLEKLVRVFYMDCVEASLNKNTSAQRFFETWEMFIEIIPQTVKVKLHECCHYTEWNITRTMSGDPPINL